MISYSNLAKALELYNALGYTRVEVPWWVAHEVANCTKPYGTPTDNEYVLSKNGKVLVASAEQGFLELIFKGYLPPGVYCAITPCFRHEQQDLLHKKCFMKLELINYLGKMTCEELALDQTQHRAKMIAHAKQVFQQLAPKANISVSFEQVSGIIDGCYDINIADAKGNKVEVGSYGIRQTQTGHSWVFGTGIAEPRFSFVIEQL